MAVAIFVNASTVNGRAAKSETKKEPSLSAETLAYALMEEGEERTFGQFGLKLGFEKTGIPYKAGEVQDPDGSQRACSIVYESDEQGHSKPICLVVGRGKKEGDTRRMHWWRVRLDGSLEKAVLSEGKLDANGKAVPGSGVYTELDVTSPEIIAAMKKELSFWLKRYSKVVKASAGGKPAAPKVSPSSSK
jgi:hypothetical protein